MSSYTPIKQAIGVDGVLYHLHDRGDEIYRTSNRTHVFSSIKENELKENIKYRQSKHCKSNKIIVAITKKSNITDTKTKLSRPPQSPPPLPPQPTINFDGLRLDDEPIRKYHRNPLKNNYMKLKHEENQENIAHLLEFSQTKHTGTHAPLKGGNDNVSLTVPPTTDIVYDVIKSSYIHNLKVIDQLYDEKKRMQNRIKMLEDIAFNHDTSRNNTNGGERAGDNNCKSVLTAAEAAELLFADNYQPIPATVVADTVAYKDKKSAKTAATVLATHDKKTKSLNNVISTKAATTTTPPTPPTTTATHTAHTHKHTHTLSKRMMADQDKYVQKQLLLKDKEERAILLQQRKEQEYEEQDRIGRENIRYPAELVARQEEFYRKKEEKLEKIREEKLLKLKQEIEGNKARTSSRNKEILANNTNAPTWQEIEEVNELKRRERIENRKESLLMSVKEPRCAGSSNCNSSGGRDKRVSIYKIPRETTIKLKETPEEVTERLAHNHACWLKKMSVAKSRSMHQQQHDTAAHAAGVVSRMSEREDVMRVKRKERIDQMTKKQEDKASVRREMHRLHMDAIMSMDVPDQSRRLTRAADARARKIRDMLIHGHTHRDNRHDKEDVFINKNNRYIVTTTAAAAAVKSIRSSSSSNSKQQSSNAVKNQIGIKRAMDDRPSLLARHQQSVVGAESSYRAIMKFNNVVSNVISSSKSNSGSNSNSNRGESKMKENQYDSKHDDDDDDKYTNRSRK